MTPEQTETSSTLSLLKPRHPRPPQEIGTPRLRRTWGVSVVQTQEVWGPTQVPTTHCPSRPPTGDNPPALGFTPGPPPPSTTPPDTLSGLHNWKLPPDDTTHFDPTSPTSSRDPTLASYPTSPSPKRWESTGTPDVDSSSERYASIKIPRHRLDHGLLPGHPPLQRWDPRSSEDHPPPAQPTRLGDKNRSPSPLPVPV